MALSCLLTGEIDRYVYVSVGDMSVIQEVDNTHNKSLALTSSFHSTHASSSENKAVGLPRR
jgi:hypothetical protein